MPSLKEKADRILFFIAINRPVNKMQIEENIKPKIDHDTIHNAVKKLNRERLIEVHHTEKIIVKFYTLTRAGLLTLLALHGRKIVMTDEAITRIMGKHSVLVPEFTALWPGIVKMGVQDIAIERLHPYCAVALQGEVRKNMRLGELREELLKRAFGDFLLEPFPTGDRDADRWRQALMRDPTLHETAKKAIQGRVAELDRVRKDLNL